jgi:L-malate glycosyltransferase
MTILHVCSGDLWAGAERMAWTLLKELRSDPDKKLVALILNEGALSRMLRALGVETWVVSEHDNSFVQLVRKSRKCLRGRNIDIIHGHGYKENLLSAFLLLLGNAAYCCATIHGLPESSRRLDGMRRVKHKLTNIVNILILKHMFRQVVAVSRDIRRVLPHQKGLKQAVTHVIHNGIDLTDWEHFRPVPRIDERVHIGTVGRMVPVKRFDRFLAIATEVVRRNQNIRFSILGDGPLKEDLAILIKRLALDKSVTLETPQEDPRAYYHSLDVYMNTSDHEGIPLSILEAMASKKPIIAPRVGGIPEIISHGEEGYLLDGGRADEFVRYCLALSADGNRRRTMGEKGNQTVVSRFSSKTMSNAYKTLYEAGIQSSRSGSAYHPHYSARSMP